MANYSFGVEIEMIAEPHKVRANLSSLHALYYAKIAASLRKRHLRAAADLLTDSHRRHPEHYDKWWITKDGSLELSEQESRTLIPIEAVSPVLSLNGNWETQIDAFWAAMAAVFHMPTRSKRCGTHVHLSRGRDTKFSLAELMTIGYGVVVFEPCITAMLVRDRANNPFCKLNTESSPLLRDILRKSRLALARTIASAHDTHTLCGIMQGSRYVLWNFANTEPGKSGTIEFRGGRFLRGKERTKRWIAFAVSLIHWLLQEKHICRPGSTPMYTPQSFYDAVKRAAVDLSLDRFLPSRYEELNETV